jgi:hypothetical protein
MNGYDRRAGRARRASRLRTLVPVMVAAMLALAACGVGASSAPTFPPADSTRAPAGEATAATRAKIAAALAVEGLQVADAAVAYRPPEGALFASAPRSVVQVQLPDDPTHGFIAVYAFDSPNAALAAAKDQAAYIASGPGNVQFAPGTQFIIRTLGSTALFFSWSPDNAADSRTASIPLALGQVGTDVPVPA